MPIYEYICDDCGTKFEKLVRRSSDVPELVCPSCGKPSRVGHRVNEDGVKVRVCRNCGKDVDR